MNRVTGKDISESVRNGNCYLNLLPDNDTIRRHVPVFVQMHIYSNSSIDDVFKDIILQSNYNVFKIFIPTFSLICVLMCLGIPGNCIALIVYLRRLKKAIARQFILTLATCDILTCSIVMPIELGIMTHFFEWDLAGLCKSFRGFAYTVNNISSLTLLAIAIERYRLVCQPWKQKFSEKTSKMICVTNIIIAVVTGLPMVFMYGTQTLPLHTVRVENSSSSCFKYQPLARKIHSNRTTVPSYSVNLRQVSHKHAVTVYGKACLMDDSMADSSFPFYIVSVYIASIIALFIVFILLYGRIVKTLATRRKESFCQKEKKSQIALAARIKKLTFMMIILTLLYVVCYLPCLTTVCIRLALPELYSTLSDSGKALFQGLLKSYLLCSALNPFVYCFCNKEFQVALLQTFRPVLPLRRKRSSGIQTDKLDTVSDSQKLEKRLTKTRTRTIDTLDL